VRIELLPTGAGPCVARGAARWVCATAAAVVFAAGCATSPVHEESPSVAHYQHLTVRVVNECMDIVHVYFVTDSGWRVRLATVGPLQSGIFTSRLISQQQGRFVTTRSAAEQSAALLGSADPLLIGARVVHLTVGPSPEFDRWLLRR
jgi:hypothetical protein